MACHSPDLLSSSSHGWSMIQRAVPYITSLYARSSRHIGSFFPRAPLIQEGRSPHRAAHRPSLPPCPLSRPSRPSTLFYLNQPIPTAPYEADNHLLSHREDVARRVGERCEFRKLDLNIVSRALVPRSPSSRLCSPPPRALLPPSPPPSRLAILPSGGRDASKRYERSLRREVREK